MALSDPALWVYRARREHVPLKEPPANDADRRSSLFGLGANSPYWRRSPHWQGAERRTPPRRPMPQAPSSHGHAAADDATGTRGRARRGYRARARPDCRVKAQPDCPVRARPDCPARTSPAPAFLQVGSANCTVAVNLNVAPNAGPPSAPRLRSLGCTRPTCKAPMRCRPRMRAARWRSSMRTTTPPRKPISPSIARRSGSRPARATTDASARLNQRGQAGSYPAANAGWSTEIALDLDMVSAACPRCSIVLVEADSALLDDLGAAVAPRPGLGATAVSNSYYAVEMVERDRARTTHYNHPGIAVTASSGDRGYPRTPRRRVSSHL